MPAERKLPQVLVLFGTRPEIIKLAPVIHRLRDRGHRATVVSSSQHRELLSPFLGILGIRTDHDLRVMRRGQGPNDVCSRTITRLDPLLKELKPDIVLVQGDTTTALAGALAAFNLGIRVGHVEAGLRSGNRLSPFPEEMNRRLISQVADLHFAATRANRDTLVSEGVRAASISVTGNPVVDSLLRIAKTLVPGPKVAATLEKTAGLRRILLTTHRRESFGDTMEGNLRVLKNFVRSRPDTCLVFPVHPNPNVRRVTDELLADEERIFLLEPLDYTDFIAVMRASWLIVSDSGGVQEEAPSLGKPLLVLRENTERPEAIESGVAKLVGRSPRSLKRLLETNYSDETWIRSVGRVKNPFGDGRAAERIATFIERKVRA